MEQARLEIIAILEKHDLMGAVQICSRERSGFFYALSPSWSCIRFEESDQGISIRIRCKAEDYPTKEAQTETLTYTINGIMGLAEVHPMTGNTLSGIIQTIATKVNFTSIATDPNIQQATLGDGD